jgi:hypothetical protein
MKIYTHALKNSPAMASKSLRCSENCRVKQEFRSETRNAVKNANHTIDLIGVRVTNLCRKVLAWSRRSLRLAPIAEVILSNYLLTDVAKCANKRRVRLLCQEQLARMSRRRGR